MRVAIMIEGQEGVSWAQWRALAVAAETADLDGLFRSDHYRSIHRGDPAGSLDAWCTIAALGTATTRIRLGTLVSPTTIRHPSVLAKAVVSADHISAGRVELGIGAGWFEPEHTAYRFPFPSERARFDEFERQLAELARQWTEAEDVWPRPCQLPRPPIIVGGRARPRSVAAAVRYADEYNTVSPTLEQARERCATVRAAAEAAGRDPLTFSMMTGCVLGRDDAEVGERLAAWRRATTLAHDPQIAGTVEQAAETLSAYARAGVERVMLQHLAHEDVEMVGLLGELARELAR